MSVKDALHIIYRDLWRDCTTRSPSLLGTWLHALIGAAAVRALVDWVPLIGDPDLARFATLVGGVVAFVCAAIVLVDFVADVAPAGRALRRRLG